MCISKFSAKALQIPNVPKYEHRVRSVERKAWLQSLQYYYSCGMEIGTPYRKEN